MNADTLGSRNGIVVYQDFNSDTEAKAPKTPPATDPYILFYMTEYAQYSFLKNKTVRDFFVLWPELMAPVATDVFAQEVEKALME